MNCKPGQMAMIVRASVMETCSALRQGVPVKVSHIVTPVDFVQAVREAFEGPVWMLAEPLRCPHGRANCPGIDRMPDACLRPFDPESDPEPESVQDERLLTVEVSTSA